LLILAGHDAADAAPSSPPETPEEHRPSSVAASGAGAWVAWSSYHLNQERILVRLAGDRGAPGPAEVVAAGGRHAAPQIALVGDQPLVVWLRGRTGAGAEVVASHRSPDGWETPVAISQGDATVVSLELARTGAPAPPATWAAWCQADAPRAYAVWAARCAGGGWSAPIRLTQPGAQVHRPDVALAPGGCWVTWDAYRDGRYAVQAAFVGDDGTPSPPELVSPVPESAGMVTPDAWQLAPSIAVDRAGTPRVAWLLLQDTSRDDGVVDQWHVARAARREAGSWGVIRDDAGRVDLASLTWSLASHQGSGVWGYLGRRRRPLVVADPESGAWLLWERKEEHDGRTPIARGELWGRRLDADGHAGRPRGLATGPRGYVPAAMELEGAERRLWVTSRPDPQHPAGSVQVASLALGGARPLDVTEDWTDWRPVRVDEPRATARPSVELDGAGYHLYWADLHVHTELSADAEGYVDEVIAYARDKAHLDAIAISDNDLSHLSLTASDWETTHHYNAHFNEDGAFVLVPAYEWTHRPDPRAQPNHRTVLSSRARFPILRNHEAGRDPLAALRAHAAAHDLLLHVHHERWEIPGAPPAPEANWEICSGWGSHFADPARREPYEAALGAGYRLGFVGNSDNHRRNPGLGGALTGVWATALTREALIEALRARRCFATDGARPVLRCWVNGVFMGGETTASQPPRVRWHAAGVSTAAGVTLMRDGAPLHTWTTTGPEASGEFEDAACAPGAHCYYLAVEQRADPAWHECPTNIAVAHGPHAWTSPVWVERTA
jgi:hypothetical protein